ncbi:2-oxo acid dehydrogenase subunit E2 [Actinomadura chibensis]|uniref:2-oxo acid dehydrogenase subunit E2 n=1 Tax=Actinomadura chibensis TaxID=392828 RepID=A0A5D0NL54_9ACTN|nr:2-oxo acid dehydrogenase subunit E2 [Actinomadura chibensis]TYB44988.1 2-oxo acid dehydrogenase subunit E2 [Actinomadura chibensis]
MAERTVAAQTPQRADRRPITGVRRMIADRMALSHRTIPGVHVVEEMDVTDVPLNRILAVTVAAVARAVADHPLFNAHVEEAHLTVFDRCDVGVAVDTERGLMVPVVREPAAKSVEEIAAEVTALARRARSGRLDRRDLTDPTITVTSPGRRGGVLATPLVNPPQTAIVGVHRAVDRPVVRGGAITIRTIANLTVTFDHRVIDGAEAGEFAIALARRIERGPEPPDTSESA